MFAELTKPSKSYNNGNYRRYSFAIPHDVNEQFRLAVLKLRAKGQDVDNSSVVTGLVKGFIKQVNNDD